MAEDPAVRRLAMVDLVGAASPDDPMESPRVRTLLEFRHDLHPYRKWEGSHWRLVSLVELGLPTRHPPALMELERVLDWLASPHRRVPRVVAGRGRMCASMEGNAVAVASRLGAADDPRTRSLVASLLEGQWPDGGWNCDARPEAHRSSFHETHATVWGLLEYSKATGDREAASAARWGAELFLEHRVYRRGGTGEAIHPEWVKFHYPAYWHYDVLRALVVLDRMGLVGDERAADALDLIEERRLPDGRWRPGAYWWKPPGSPGGGVEVVDWGRNGPNEMVTLDALRVLKGAGRWP